MSSDRRSGSTDHEGPAQSPSREDGPLAEAFAHARELAEGERAEYLAEFATAYPDLAAELQSLLAAADDASQFLEDSPVLALEEEYRADSEQGQDDRVGDLIGPYRVLAVLGYGGMGTVYRAERVDGGFAQEVALKVTRVPFGSGRADRRDVSEALADRFLQERQILAGLDHPNIARLLDGGLSDDQRPYFAMELVDGDPLLRACDEQMLSVSERVAVFEQACRAVQAAHSRLVVHRDIKPSNIMLNSRGELKLLDFGIAKLLNPDIADNEPEEALTFAGLTPHTPGYAAPEQLRGEPATVATDVYSLGVVLYELLVGHRPDHADPTGQRVGVLRPSTAVLQDTPATDAAETTAEGTTTSAMRRSTTPSALSRALAGDLEAILQRALEPDPDDRYPTADAMAEDLERYKLGLPVQARRAGWTYRASKLIRRHWGLSSAIAAAVLALIVGFGVSLWQAGVAQEERLRAEDEASKARRVQELLVEVLSQTNPNATKGEDLSPKELLDRSVETVRSRLSDEPEALASLLDSMARVYRAYSDLPRMEDVAREAVEVRRGLDPDGSVALAKSLGLLASARYRQSHMAEGEAFYRESVEMLERLDDASALDVASAMNGLAVALADQSKHEEAETYYRQALAIRERELGENDGSVGVSRGNLGLLLHDRGQFEEAEQLLRSAHQTLEVVHGPENLVVANNLTFLGVVLRSAGKFDESQAVYQQAYDIYVKLLGPESYQAARALSFMGLVAGARGDHVEAERMLRESIAAQRVSLGPDHINVGAALTQLATTLVNQDRLEESIDVYRQGMEIRSELDGDLVNAWSTSMVAESLRRLGRLEEARVEAARGTELLRQSVGEQHWRFAVGLETEATVLHELGDLEQAAENLALALKVRRAAQGEEHVATGWTQVLSGEVELSRHNGAAAEEHFRSALAVLEGAEAKDAWRRGAAMSGLGAARQSVGEDSPEIDALLDDGYRILRESEGARPMWIERAARRASEAGEAD